MDEADVVVARTFADLVIISVLQHDVATGTQRVNEPLSNGLSSRTIIEQAEGIVFERVGNVDMAEVFSRLRRFARDHNRRLTDVAQRLSTAASILKPARPPRGTHGDNACLILGDRGA